MINYETIEEDIRTRIATPMHMDTDVIVLPESEAGFKRSTTKGLITVAYKSSDYGQIGGTENVQMMSLGSSVAQQETICVSITIEARQLRGDYGIYNTIRLVKLALIGFEPTDCRKLYAVSDGFINFKEGIWFYELKVATTTLLVSDEECEDPEGPIITQIKVDSPFGQSVTPPTE